ncbi:PAS domain S-box protein, partial [Pseudomonas aeruginosa]
LSRDEMMDRSAHELGLWPDINEARRLAAAVAETGLVRDFRSAILVSGQWRDLLVSAATLEWEGEPCMMMIGRDITDSERARIEAEAI